MTAPEIHPETLAYLAGLLSTLALVGWCLVVCGLGAVLVRFQCVTGLALLAAAGGALLVGWVRAEPQPLDFLIVGGGLAIAGGLLGWFFWRAWIALGAALCVLPIGLPLMVVLEWAAWPVAALLAVVILLLAYRWARGLTILVSALLGAGGAVYALIGYCIVPEATPQSLAEALQFTPAQVVALWVGLPVTVALAIAGGWMQVRALRRLAASEPAPKSAEKKAA